MLADGPANPALATVSRGGEVESLHRGSLAVVRGGRIVHAFGNVEQPVFCRSATKPLQALPLLELGVAERLRLADAELALMVASHQGTARHVAGVRSLLAKGGASEAELGCGPHAPLDRRSAEELLQNGARPTPIHNNCSGKHAGFVLLARELGVGATRCLDPEAEPQLRVREAIAAVADVPAASLVPALDGCGAPTYRLPLWRLAHAFARLANPSALGDVREATCRRLLEAVTKEPFFLAGAGQLTTALVESLPGRVFPKNGAEGVYAVGFPGLDLGLALKIDDGSSRAVGPIVVEALVRLGVLAEMPAALAAHARVSLSNTQGKPIGAIESVVPWRQLP